MRTVKWLDIRFGDEEYSAVKRALDGGDVSGFAPIVAEFAELCREYTGAKYALACCNATAALLVALMAIKRLLGKELTIAVPTWTYIAPANAADFFGNLVLIDSEPQSHNMSSELPAGLDVICPVDMAGIPADYDAFASYGVPVLADAAESFGATYKDRRVGTLGDISVTSFQSAKIITSGEGGMIFTDNDDLAVLCRNIINQGYGPRGYAEHSHIAKGYNFRMSALQAALGCAQLPKLADHLTARTRVARIYDEVNCQGLTHHAIPTECRTNYYSYLVLLPSREVRDHLKSRLQEDGISSKLWSPVHSHAPYASYPADNFPNANYIYDHHLRLPIHNAMTEDDASFVADRIVAALSSL